MGELKETVKTTFIGHYTCTVMATFYGDFPWTKVCISPYPIDPFAVPFQWKKFKHHLMGNVPSEIVHHDFIELDPYSGEATKIKHRYVFMDILWNVNREITRNLPATVTMKNRIRNLQAERDEYFNLFQETLSIMRNNLEDQRWSVIKDQIDKVVAARKALYVPFPTDLK